MNNMIIIILSYYEKLIYTTNKPLVIIINLTEHGKESIL